jgi:hypothetical protein
VHKGLIGGVGVSGAVGAVGEVGGVGEVGELIIVLLQVRASSVSK